MSANLAHGGASVAGYAVGVLHLQTVYPLFPGNTQHAQSFPRPVLFEAVDVDDVWALMRGEPDIAPKILAAARRLEDKGVRIIAGACGSFAYYQQTVAAQLRVPAFLSVLTQIPFLLQSLGGGRLGVVCASASSMNERTYDACGINDPSRLVVREMSGSPTFDHMLAGGSPINSEALCEETCAVAEKLVADAPDVKAILFQCSDLPPFASAVQARVNLPVFDATVMIRSLCLSADYAPYRGFNRLGAQ